MSKTTIPTGGLADAAVTTAKITDANITTAKIADDAVTAAKATGLGISEVDNWRLSSSFTGDATPITGWERNDTDFDKIGTGLTHSSGTFSFPSTGIYLITVIFKNSFNGDSRYCEGEIMVTSDNSSYTVRATNSQNIKQTDSTTPVASSTSCIIDVTNTTNVKFQIRMLVEDNGTTTSGSSTANITHFTSIRLGDT